MNESADAGKFFALIGGAVGFVLLLAFIHQRKNRTVSPKKVTHPGKLLKEIMKTVPLRPVELKQLKVLAEQSRGADGEPRVTSPLTLILCPSVLVKAMKAPPAKVDKKVIAAIARKLGAHDKLAVAKAR